MMLTQSKQKQQMNETGEYVQQKRPKKSKKKKKKQNIDSSNLYNERASQNGTFNSSKHMINQSPSVTQMQMRDNDKSDEEEYYRPMTRD